MSNALRFFEGLGEESSTPGTASKNGLPPKRVRTLEEMLDPDEWDEFNKKLNGKIKVLRFRDGSDVTLVPEGEVESIGSFSPTGATLTLKSGQEVVVDRNAGVDAVEVDSIEEMVRMLVNKKEKKAVLTERISNNNRKKGKNGL